MPSEAAIAFARDYLDRHIRVNEGDVMQLATRLDAFVAERVEAERERCAKIAEAWEPSPEERRELRHTSADNTWDGIDRASRGIAAAIRALPGGEG